MRLISRASGLALAAGIFVAGGIGAARFQPTDFEGHRSSLPATLTMLDGSTRSVTIEGVGCPSAMCSRVKARKRTNGIWLDGLLSVQAISRSPGPVTATFRFKDGVQSRATILAVNRVLYVQDRFGRGERIDLGSVSRIDFQR